MATKKENNQILLLVAVGVGIYLLTRKNYTVTPGDLSDPTFLPDTLQNTNNPDMLQVIDPENSIWNKPLDYYQEFEGVINGPAAPRRAPTKPRTII